MEISGRSGMRKRRLSSSSAAAATRQSAGRRRAWGGVALRRKVRELRRLVPGGEGAPAGRLLLRAADYIVRLRARVELLRALAALYDDDGGLPLAAAAP